MVYVHNLLDLSWKINAAIKLMIPRGRFCHKRVKYSLKFETLKKPGAIIKAPIQPELKLKSTAEIPSKRVFFEIRFTILEGYHFFPQKNPPFYGWEFYWVTRLLCYWFIFVFGL